MQLIRTLETQQRALEENRIVTKSQPFARAGLGGRNDFLLLGWVETPTEGWEKCGQASKGVWGMSWRQKAKKGVDKLR